MALGRNIPPTHWPIQQSGSMSAYQKQAAARKFIPMIESGMVVDTNAPDSINGKAFRKCRVLATLRHDRPWSGSPDSIRERLPLGFSAACRRLPGHDAHDLRLQEATP